MRIKNKLFIITIILMIILQISINLFLFKSNAKEDIVIVLDPGHGGIDPGAMNVTYNINEADVNLKIARYLEEYLNEYSGVKVLKTHNGLNSNAKLEVKDRSMFARNNNADIIISLHINASTTSGLKGAEVYVTNSTVLPKYKEETSKLANKILSNLNNLGIVNRGVKTRICQDNEDEWLYSDGSHADYYGIIRYAMKGDSGGRGADIEKGEGLPAMIVEHCFITDSDRDYIDSDEDIKRLAKADADAIVSYYNLTKKSLTVSGIYLNKSETTMVIGETEQLEATVIPDSAINKNVIWSSQNKNVAEVDSNGKITAKGKGVTTITARSEQREEITASIIVQVEEINIVAGKDSINLFEGSSYRLTTKLTPYEAKDNVIVWSSEDENVATVDQNGIVTAKTAGTTNIIATSNSKTAITEVNVTEKGENEITIEGLEIQNGIIYLNEGVKLSNINNKITTNLDVEFKDIGAKDISLDSNAGTGNRILFYDSEKNLKHEYDIIVLGDANGDGKVLASDYLIVKDYIMNSKIFNVFLIEGADMKKDNKITAADYLKIKDYIMNKE